MSKQKTYYEKYMATFTKEVTKPVPVTEQHIKQANGNWSIAWRNATYEALLRIAQESAKRADTKSPHA
jgi:hypothetical protein